MTDCSTVQPSFFFPLDFPVPICVIDSKSRLTFATDAAYCLFGFECCTPDAETKLKDIPSKRIAALIKRCHHAALKNQEPIVTQEDGIVDKLGNKKRYLINTLCIKHPLASGKATLSYWMDITHIKDDKNSNNNDIFNYLSIISSLIPANVYWLDPQQKVIGVNDRTLRAIGASSLDQLVGRTVYDFYPPEMAKEISDNLAEATTKNRPCRHEEKIEDLQSGESRYFEAIKAPIHDTLGNIIGIVGISIEITDRKKLEKQVLAEKENAEAANRAKSEFIANMSHDIRTPITGILAMAERLCASANDSSQVTENFKHALHELAHQVHGDSSLLIGATYELLNLCNEIIEIIKIDSGYDADKIELFSIPELVTHSINLFMPAVKNKNLELVYKIDPSVPEYCKGSRLYLDRILLNLIGNAIKFTEKGHVKIFVQRIDEAPLTPGTTVVIKLSVEDTGIGIPQDKQTVIFEHFSRLNSSYSGVYKGSGLGLYTVQRYVESLQGFISVKSRLDHGSCFTVEIPLIVASSEEASVEKMTKEASKIKKDESGLLEIHSSGKSLNTTSAHPQTLQKKEPAIVRDGSPKILVVEDSMLAFVALEMKLRPYKCHVDHATTGQQAIDKATTNRYDLVFMDVGLPDFSGIIATQEIRTVHASENLPIVAVTGHADDEEQRAACFAAGMQVVLSKPADASEISDVFSTYIQQQEEKSLPDKEIIDWFGCVHCCQGDEETTQYMLSLIADDCRQASDILQHHGDPSYYPKIRAILHRIRGNIRYLKLPELSITCKELHEAIRAQDKEQIASCCHAFQQARIRFEQEKQLIRI